MNLYICLIIFGIKLFLLWNRKDKFSVGGNWRTCKNNFNINKDYGMDGIHNLYSCCDSIIQNELSSVDFDESENSILNQIDSILSLPGIISSDYSNLQKSNIKEYVRGCGIREQTKNLCTRYGGTPNFDNVDFQGNTVSFGVMCNIPCNQNDCNNHGTASGIKPDCICNCNDGWSGNNCNIFSPSPSPESSSAPTTDPCNPNPCQNDGFCEVTQEDYPNDYFCHCRSDYTGINCEISRSPNLIVPIIGLFTGLCAVAYSNRPDIQRQQVPQSDEENPENLDLSLTASESDSESDSDSRYTPVPETVQQQQQQQQPQSQTKTTQYFPTGLTGSTFGASSEPSQRSGEGG